MTELPRHSYANWPEWACDEDVETVWIRADLARLDTFDAVPGLTAVASPPGEGDGWWRTLLVFESIEPCWLNLTPEYPWDGWSIQPSHEDDPMDDAVAYWRYVTTDDAPQPGEVVFGATA